MALTGDVQCSDFKPHQQRGISKSHDLTSLGRDLAFN